MPGKIRGNGLSVAMEAKRLGEKLSITEVETLSVGAIHELQELGYKVDAIVQDWHEIKMEEKGGEEKENGSV